jgi:hypothetical protein
MTAHQMRGAGRALAVGLTSPTTADVFAIKDDRSFVGTETMRKLTTTEHRILNVLRQLPGQSIPIEAIAEQSGLTAKRVWVCGRELAQLKLARAILHRVYIGPHFISTFSLQLEPTSKGG